MGAFEMSVLAVLIGLAITLLTFWLVEDDE